MMTKNEIQFTIRSESVNNIGRIERVRCFVSRTRVNDNNDIQLTTSSYFSR